MECKVCYLRDKKPLTLLLDLSEKDYEKVATLVGCVIEVRKISRKLTESELLSQWQTAVAQGETKLGYVEWLAEFKNDGFE